MMPIVANDQGSWCVLKQKLKSHYVTIIKLSLYYGNKNSFRDIIKSIVIIKAYCVVDIDWTFD